MDDWVAIHDTMVRFCYLVDTRQGARLMAEVLTTDATFDYGEGPVPAASQTSGSARLEVLESTVHSLSNILITITGDVAHASAYVTASHWLTTSTDAGPLRAADFVTTTAYENDLRREENGWRISARRLRPVGRGIVSAGEVPAGSQFPDLFMTIAAAPPVNAPPG